MLEKCYRDRLTSKKITVMEPNKEKNSSRAIKFREIQPSEMA
jgi:hypothetical protein